jgi:hypothetical protein
LVGVGPIGSNAVAQSVIPYYNGYFADTWHVKPSVTISYGLSYQVEMPPHEQNSKRVTMVYRDGSPVVTADYMAQRQKAALAGTVYNPALGFETPNNIGAGRQAFGEVGTTSSATTSFTTNAPAAAPFTGGSSTNYHVAGSGGVAREAVPRQGSSGHQLHGVDLGPGCAALHDAAAAGVRATGLRRAGRALAFLGGRPFTWRRTKNSVTAAAITEENKVSIEFT